MDEALGRRMHDLATELFPICRSITGNGTRQTLTRLQRELPALSLYEVPSGTTCFDWTVPREWNIDDAYILGPSGDKLIDFQRSNLHVVGYSIPIDCSMPLEELQKHLHSLPDRPDAIPYVTSYYQDRWGFCLSHRQRSSLQEGQYRVVIKSRLTHGALTYADLLIPGQSEKEVLLSTYICHPSMANNELSGPVVQTFLGKWLESLPSRRFSYRLVFIPETIGSITYISRNLARLRDKVIAGYNISCVGDERAYSYLPSRKGNTISDRVALHVLQNIASGFIRYSFSQRGSDERQYCSPGVDLPIASVMRSKYGEYPEYHSSDDDLQLVTPAGLFGGFEALRLCLLSVEKNLTYKAQFPCEPQLGRRGLYPTLSTRAKVPDVRMMMDLLAYADGTTDLLAVAEAIGQPLWTLIDAVDKLVEHELIRAID